jgi:pSer/pThr/pTyr-binding forkhead associated (FHA) protein
MNVKLLVVQGRPSGKHFDFGRGEYYFGRGNECHVRPNSDWVSRQHCLLRVTQDAAFLRDLGSRNGTLVNGALLEGERCLAEGDLVQVGPLVFQVHLEGDPPTTLARDDRTVEITGITFPEPEGPPDAVTNPQPLRAPGPSGSFIPRPPKGQ